MDFRAAMHVIHRYERFVGGWTSPAFGCVVEIRGVWELGGLGYGLDLMFSNLKSGDWRELGWRFGCGNGSGIQETVLASG